MIFKWLRFELYLLYVSIVVLKKEFLFFKTLKRLSQDRCRRACDRFLTTLVFGFAQPPGGFGMTYRAPSLPPLFKLSFWRRSLKNLFFTLFGTVIGIRRRRERNLCSFTNSDVLFFNHMDFIAYRLDSPVINASFKFSCRLSNGVFSQYNSRESNAHQILSEQTNTIWKTLNLRYKPRLVENIQVLIYKYWSWKHLQ